LDFFAGRAHLLGLSGRCGPYQCQSEEQRDAAAHLSLCLVAVAAYREEEKKKKKGKTEI
jgi:hypothetical protein